MTAAPEMPTQLGREEVGAYARERSASAGSPLTAHRGEAGSTPKPLGDAAAAMLEPLLEPTVGVVFTRRAVADGATVARHWFGAPEALVEVAAPPGDVVRVGTALDVAGLASLLESALPSGCDAASAESLLSRAGLEVVSLAVHEPRPMPDGAALWTAGKLTILADGECAVVLETAAETGGARARPLQVDEIRGFLDTAIGALTRDGRPAVDWRPLAKAWAAKSAPEPGSATMIVHERLVVDDAAAAAVVSMTLELDDPQGQAAGIEALTEQGLAVPLGDRVHTLSPTLAAFVAAPFVADASIELWSRTAFGVDRMTLEVSPTSVVQAQRLSSDSGIQYTRFDAADVVTLVQHALSLWPAADGAESATGVSLDEGVIEGLDSEDEVRRGTAFERLAEAVGVQAAGEISFDGLIVRLGASERSRYGWLEWVSCRDGRAFLIDESTGGLAATTRAQIVERILCILPGGGEWRPSRARSSARRRA